MNIAELIDGGGALTGRPPGVLDAVVAKRLRRLADDGTMGDPEMGDDGSANAQAMPFSPVSVPPNSSLPSSPQLLSAAALSDSPQPQQDGAPLRSVPGSLQAFDGPAPVRTTTPPMFPSTGHAGGALPNNPPTNRQPSLGQVGPQSGAPASGGSGSTGAIPADGQMLPAEQREQDLLLHRPERGVKQIPVVDAQGNPLLDAQGNPVMQNRPISKLRRVAGEIASIAGPIIGGPGVSLLGQRLLYPGQDKWARDLETAEELSKLGETVQNRQLRTQQIGSQADARRSAADTRANTEYLNQTKGLIPIASNPEQAAGIPATVNRLQDLPPSPALSQVPGQGPPAPHLMGPMPLPPSPALSAPPQDAAPDVSSLPQLRTRVSPGMPGLPLENQIDPDIGRPMNQAGNVKRITNPATKETETFLKPSATTLAQMAADKAKQTRGALLEAQRDTWPTATPEMATALKTFGVKEGDPVDPVLYKSYVDNTLKPEKPEPATKAKQDFSATVSKVAAEGHLPMAALSDVHKLGGAIVASTTLTPQEKQDALAYLAANTTPAAAGTNTTIRVEGMQQAREQAVLDTQNSNTPMFLNSAEINKANQETPGRYMPVGAGVPALNKTALIEDIRGNVQQVRQSLAQMPDFDAMDKAKIAVALRSRDPRGSINALLSGAAAGSLSPQQQDYLINLTNLVENAMAMRSVLGAGAGSEDMRTAITATIPGPTTPNKEYAFKQLDTFEKTLNRLERGVPKVPLRTDTGDAGGAASTAAAPIPPAVQNLLKTASPGIHTLSDGSKWMKNADGTIKGQQ